MPWMRSSVRSRCRPWCWRKNLRGSAGTTFFRSSTRFCTRRVCSLSGRKCRGRSQQIQRQTGHLADHPSLRTDTALCASRPTGRKALGTGAGTRVGMLLCIQGFGCLLSNDKGVAVQRVCSRFLSRGLGRETSSGSSQTLRLSAQPTTVPTFSSCAQPPPAAATQPNPSQQSRSTRFITTRRITRWHNSRLGIAG